MIIIFDLPLFINLVIFIKQYLAYVHCFFPSSSYLSEAYGREIH